jgi:hypothetical protein
VTSSREVEAEIARLFHAEHWKVGTIAAQLGVHEDVVRRVIRGHPRAPRAKAPAPSAIAPFVLTPALVDRSEVGSAHAL